MIIQVYTSINSTFAAFLANEFIETIKAAAKIAVQGMMASYPGDNPGSPPGLWPPPYYWWEGGAAMGVIWTSLLRSCNRILNCCPEGPS